jgi:hypothetical protein
MNVVIGGPGPGQVIRPGDLTVTGTATGREGPEPVAIQSVTVNGKAATLTRTPGSVTVGFTATVHMPAWVPTSTITATAVDDLGFRTAASVTVRMGGGWVGSWSELYSDIENMATLDVVANADGRLEVFGVGSSGTIWHTWQTQPGGPWVGNWSELYTDNDRLATLAAARNADGRLEVFGVSSSGTIWHTWQTQPGGPWVGNWSELYTDNDKLVNLSVAVNKDGRVEAFGCRTFSDIQGAFLHTWQTRPGAIWAGTWSQLYTRSGPFFPFTVAANADGRLELFGLSANGELSHTVQTQPGSWDGGMWSLLAGGPLPPWRFLGVASNADGRLEFFVADPGGEVDSNQIWYTAQTPAGSWDGGWGQLPPLSTDHNVPPVNTGDFAVGQNGAGKLELVANVVDSPGMMHIGQTQPGIWAGSGWTGLYSASDGFGNLNMARNADGRLEVFGIRSDGTVWHTWRDWDVPFEGTPTGTVPSVIDLSPDEARAEIESAGFTFGSTAGPVRGTLTPHVESQNPVGGATAPLGSAVNVTIAVPVTGTVPDVLNLSPGAARAKIEAAGFACSEAADPVEGNFKPYVEDQNPGGEATAPLGSTVNVTIAVPVKGPPR